METQLTFEQLKAMLRNAGQDDLRFDNIVQTGVSAASILFQPSTLADWSWWQDMPNVDRKQKMVLVGEANEEDFYHTLDGIADDSCIPQGKYSPKFSEEEIDVDTIAMIAPMCTTDLMKRCYHDITNGIGLKMFNSDTPMFARFVSMLLFKYTETLQKSLFTMACFGDKTSDNPYLRRAKNYTGAFARIEQLAKLNEIPNKSVLGSLDSSARLIATGAAEIGFRTALELQGSELRDTDKSNKVFICDDSVIDNYRASLRTKNQSDATITINGVENLQFDGIPIERLRVNRKYLNAAWGSGKAGIILSDKRNFFRAWDGNDPNMYVEILWDNLKKRHQFSHALRHGAALGFKDLVTLVH